MNPEILATIHRRVDAEIDSRRARLQDEYQAVRSRMAARGILQSSITGKAVADLCVDEINARGEIVWKLTRDTLSRVRTAFDTDIAVQTKALIREKLPPELPDLYQLINNSMKGLKNDSFKLQFESILRIAYENLLARLDSDIDLECLGSQGETVTHSPSIQSRDFDVFVSHASEDKDDFVRPLAEAIKESGLRVWYDEYSLSWGDRLRRSIDKGLVSSKYGIVVLSPKFFEKEWTQRELDGLTALELDDGRKRILPLWHKIDVAGVKRYSPTLGDVVGIPTGIGIPSIVTRLLELLKT